MFCAGDMLKHNLHDCTLMDAENPYRSPQTPSEGHSGGWQPVLETACYVVAVVCGSALPATAVLSAPTFFEALALFACALGAWSAGRCVTAEKPLWFAVSILCVALAALFLLR